MLVPFNPLLQMIKLMHGESKKMVQGYQVSEVGYEPPESGSGTFIL